MPPVGVQEYIYVGTPPEATTVAEALLPPLHNSFTWLETAVSKVGSVKVIDEVVKHPFASVIVHVYD